jgi:hypothetical protein
MSSTQSLDASFTLESRPDVLIRRHSRRVFVGDGIYNLSGAGQRVSATTKGKGRAVFVIRAQNDGTAIDSFLVTGPGSGRRFRVRYALGRSDVTGLVTTNGLRLGGVVPGSSRAIRMIVTSLTRLHVTRSWAVLIHSRKSVQGDVVRARLRVA